MSPIRVVLVGMGKIARDQHLPAIAGNPNFTLAATVSRNAGGLPGVAHAKTLEALLQDGLKLDAAVLCTPPQARYDLAQFALSRGLHVFLEKPPGATLSEVEALREQSVRCGSTLFASWHSRFAPGVEPARKWLAGRQIRKVSVVWREDVRQWHPGQAWVWEAGGLGVFDPGINALSILTHILPQPFFLTDAVLALPENRAVPIAADLSFRDINGAPISVNLDWRQTGTQSWNIGVETDTEPLMLSLGGAVLSLPSGTEHMEEQEYAGLYRRFATLVQNKQSDVDTRPLQLTADAFLRGRREIVEPFVE